MQPTTITTPKHWPVSPVGEVLRVKDASTGRLLYSFTVTSPPQERGGKQVYNALRTIHRERTKLSNSTRRHHLEPVQRTQSGTRSPQSDRLQLPLALLFRTDLPGLRGHRLRAELAHPPAIPRERKGGHVDLMDGASKAQEELVLSAKRV